jgi:hypothetical protein
VLGVWSYDWCAAIHAVFISQRHGRCMLTRKLHAIDDVVLYGLKAR